MSELRRFLGVLGNTLVDRGETQQDPTLMGLGYSILESLEETKPDYGEKPESPLERWGIGGPSV